MKHRPNILRAKLSVSKRADTLERARLTRRLSALLEKKLALVIAGAGYGKTTLIGQALAGFKADALWYCLDESDRDVATFLGYLCAGMKRHHPSFGEAFEEKLPRAFLSRSDRERVLLDFLLDVEALVQAHTLIVLDDYHLVQDSPEISEAMAFLLGRMPETLHFILIGRKEPPLKISRYRAMREVIDIQEEDLLFSPEEIAGLYRLIARREIGGSEAQRLFEDTGGWAAALVLCRGGKDDTPTAGRKERFFGSQRSRQLIFQYLEENVFDRLPPDLKTFMMKTAFLSHLDPGFINSLFHIHDAEEVLQALSREHLLVFSKADTADGFAYHHLLRDFLRDRFCREDGPEALQALHFEIGHLMGQRGDVQGALRHFLQGGHFDALRRLIAGMAFRDFLDCPFGFLMEVFGALPEEIVQTDASLLYVGAKLSSMRGQIAAALAGFRAALSRFEEAGEEMGALSCAKDLAFHLYLTGDVLAATEQMRPLLGKPHRDPFFPVEISGYLILFSAILGEMMAADRYYDAIQAGAAGADAASGAFPGAWLDLCYSYRLHSAGDFERADAMNRRVLDTFTRMGLELLLPLANFQASLTFFYRGDPAAGGAYAREGLRLADRFGINDAQLAWLLYARGLNGYGTGALSAAAADAVAAFEIFRRLGNTWGQASVEGLSAMICRARGMSAEAAEHLRAALSRIEGLHLRVTEGALALQLAELMVDQGEGADAEALLHSHGDAIGVSRFHLFCCRFLQARIHADRQDIPKARDAMAAGLELACAHHYIPWVERQLDWAVPVLAACHGAGLMCDFIEGILKGPQAEAARDALLPLKKAGGRRVRRAANALLSVLPERQPAPLFIRCLGAFEVAVGERIVPPECWRNAKAATLFKYLTLKSGQGFVPKERLLELVWPDEPEEKTRPRFHVAMTTLRKALEPALRRGDPSSYLLRQNDAYQLKIGDTGGIDFRAFAAALSEAKGADGADIDAALGRYRRAEAMYTGPLFGEDPYLEWAAADRDLLESGYLDVLTRIISLCEKKADWRGLIATAEKYLRLDICGEAVYGALMRAYAQLGETARILMSFDSCRAALAAHLDGAPGAALCSLYEALTGKKPPV